MWMCRMNWNSLHFRCLFSPSVNSKQARTLFSLALSLCFLSITAPFSLVSFSFHSSWLFLFLLDFLSITCIAITTRTSKSHLFLLPCFSSCPFSPLSPLLQWQQSQDNQSPIDCACAHRLCHLLDHHLLLLTFHHHSISRTSPLHLTSREQVIAK